MNTLGNIIWFLLIGLWSAIMVAVWGLLWCITIVGIPVGVQAFKIAGLCLFPFGKRVDYGGGAGSLILNVLWLLFGGLESAVGLLVAGVICCITIIGIPFGKQCFKIAKLVLMPFGANISN